LSAAGVFTGGAPVNRSQPDRVHQAGLRLVAAPRENVVRGLKEDRIDLVRANRPQDLQLGCCCAAQTSEFFRLDDRELLGRDFEPALELRRTNGLRAVTRADARNASGLILVQFLWRAAGFPASAQS
jgi:hypothetical protein